MPGAVPTGAGNISPSDATIKQVSINMSTTAATMVTQHDFVMAQSKKKIPGFKKLGSHAHKLFLFASYHDQET
jgi:hypothetical protein